MRFRSTVALLAASVVVLSAGPASAAPNKPFRMDVAPAEVWAGVTQSAYQLTLTNLTESQRLGSADITIPAALTVVGAPSLGTVTGGNVLQLRSLAVPPGGSVTVTIPLRMPCVADAYEWGVVAKQSNDFSGPPGNDLGPVSGVRTTTVQGSCRLRFFAQPATAERNEQIRADALSPTSPNLVSVEALDGRPTGAQRLTWFTGGIRLTLGPSAYGGRLSPQTQTSAAQAGLATFANLSIDQSGVYTLRASAVDPGFTGADSASFQIIGVVEDCNSSACRAQLGDSTLTGTGVTGTGNALLSQNLGNEPVCNGYRPPTNDWYEFALTVAGDKTVDTFYSRSEVQAVGGRLALEICFAAPQDFPAKNGPTQPFDYDGDGSTADGHVGLLPDCPATPVSPCVLARSPAAGGAAIVTFFVPASWGDPRYH